MDDDGRRTMMMEEKSRKGWKRNIFKSCWDGLGTIGGGTNGPPKFDSNEIHEKKESKSVFVVIRLYGYGSIRTDLISMSRPVLDRNETNNKIIKFVINIYKSS